MYGIELIDADFFVGNFLPELGPLWIAVFLDQASFGDQIALLFHIEAMCKKPEFAVAKV